MITSVATSQDWKNTNIGQITKSWINGKHQIVEMN
jgi:hypothetical protein